MNIPVHDGYIKYVSRVNAGKGLQITTSGLKARTADIAKRSSLRDSSNEIKVNHSDARERAKTFYVIRSLVYSAKAHGSLIYTAFNHT